MNVRRVLSGVGRTLISLGVLVLLFVAYQLWGTGIAESRSQHHLRSEINKVLRSTTTTASTVLEATTTTSPEEAPPPTPSGDAVAILRIPKIGVDKVVVEGVGVPDLKKGPGHYPHTPLPGQPGNAAIAGHRTTYGAPFNRLDELKAGDPILVTTREGPFRYQVDRNMVVKPTATEVLDPTPDNRLTLTTCNPKYSAKERLIVVARLIGPAVTPPPTTTVPNAPPPKLAGLSGEHAPKTPAILWGLGAGLVWFLAWYLGRRWRRWPAYFIAAPVFLVVLYFFFENFARLLPANI